MSDPQVKDGTKILLGLLAVALSILILASQISRPKPLSFIEATRCQVAANAYVKAAMHCPEAGGS